MARLGRHRAGQNDTSNMGGGSQRTLLLTITVGMFLVASYVSEVFHQNRLASYLPKELLQFKDDLLEQLFLEEEKNATQSVLDTGRTNNTDGSQRHNETNSTDTGTPQQSVPTLDHTNPHSPISTIPNQDEDLWNTRATIPLIPMVPPEEQQCFAVEHVCMSGRHWFYQDTSTAPHNMQPGVILELGKTAAQHNTPFFQRSYPARIEIAPAQSRGTNGNLRNTQANITTCRTSPIRNHMILASSFNDMLGEFYTRLLVPMTQALHLWFRHDQTKVLQFLHETQLYLQLTEGNHKHLLDSHHLFTSAFRPNGLPLTDLRHLLDAQTASCTCVPRLVFCGYRVEPTRDTTGIDTTTTLRSAGYFVNGLDKKYKATMYQETRTFLRQQTIDHNPVLLDEIDVYRESIWNKWNQALLQSHHQPLSKSSKEATLVGLTQRSGRRGWRNLNIDSNPIAQQLAMEHAVLLVEINVEEDHWNPHNQLVRHAALDVLVGIHGAQLTEAIWMKPGSLVVELLPFVPTGVLLGGWTRNVHDATPLGVNFYQSDLVHVGYPVTPEETPYCGHNATDVPCWRQHLWANREFEVGLGRIQQILQRFWMEKPTTCHEYETLSARATSGCVVYNAPCRKQQQPQQQQGNETLSLPPRLVPHQYFWETPYPW